MAFENLFSPIKIRGMELKNRVLFPAMGTKMADDEGFVTDKLIDYHVARALGGNGLNMVEVSCVHGPSAPTDFLGIYDDKFIPEMKRLCDEVHAAGAKVGVQLWQGGVAVATYPGVEVVVPSDLPIPDSDHVIKGATVEKIAEMVEAFGQAAKRAVEAGFDCIEFHAAHNYSPHAFLSAAFNKRDDEYGGSLENRARYSLECIRAIRQNIPQDMPLFMRIDAHDDYLEDGLTIEDVIEFCLMAKEEGVDVLDVSRGNISSAAIKYEVPPIDIPRGFNVENAARIKKETGMITVAVGRINTPALAEEILADGKADMVVIGRSQLADPEFCNKAFAGNVSDIVMCIGCNQGCFDGFVSPEMPHITCLRNPSVGREAEYALKKTDSPKTVAVVGGGMAGLEAAMVLKQRGHKPVLFEASDKLGGQFLLAGEAPRKEEMRDAAISKGDQVKAAGVDVRLSTPATPDLLKELSPDLVVVAVGAVPTKLDIPGGDLPHVTDSHQVLKGKVDVGDKVLVVGGGLVGLEAAEYLAEKGKSVTVVEMLDEVGKDLGQIRKICVLESLYALEVDTLVNTKCMEIKEDGIVVERDGAHQELKADNVVVAIGSKPLAFDGIAKYCEENEIPHYVIGDALRPRKAIDAIAEAAQLAREI